MKKFTQKKQILRTISLFSVMAIFLASCGSGDSSSDETTFYIKESVSPK